MELPAGWFSLRADFRPELRLDSNRYEERFPCIPQLDAEHPRHVALAAGTARELELCSDAVNAAVAHRHAAHCASPWVQFHFVDEAA